MNKIEEFFSSESKLCDRKKFSIISGILAYLLIISAVVNNFVSHDYLFTIIKLFYAFFILLPISYYQLKAYNYNFLDYN